MHVEKRRTTTKIDILDERAACNKQPVISNLSCLWLAIKEKFAEAEEKANLEHRNLTYEEKIEISDEDAEAEAEKMSAEYGVEKEEFLKHFGGLEVVKYDLKMRKALEILGE